ncbi:MAG: hypothetical protein K2H85_07960, partial [Allobaculum sp.]|nr:hypothetical protein [Allobaculum sp.]
ISGEGLRSEGKVNFKNGGSVPTVTNYSGSTTITVTKTEAGNDFYISMLPCGDVIPTFTVVKGGYIYTAELGKHKWISGEFVRKNTNGDPVAVTEWTKKALPVDYGNMGNWIKDNINVDTNVFTAIYMSNGVENDQNKNSWETNFRQLGIADEYGGWVTAVEYTNGLMLNMLTSNGGRDFYFQWGRQMGFPSAVGSSTIAYYPLGSDEASNLNYWIGYYGNSGMTVYYENVYMGSTNWPMGRVNNSSLAFGKVSRLSSGPFDYSLPNTECTWEERSGGNICPDEYRIPTAEELSFFVPSTGKVSGTYAEIKTVNGKRYAIQWTATATSGNTPATVSIKSVETTKASVSNNDEIFKNAPQLNLRTYGYINNEAEFEDRGKIGIYWSNETGNAADWKPGASGNGGQALFIKFTASTTAEISMKGVPRSYGACVVPIKDKDAKGISYRPYFPWAGKIPAGFTLN